MSSSSESTAVATSATLPADLAPQSVRAAAGDCRLVRHLVVLNRVRSTMALAGQLAIAGAPEGTTVIADFQTAGRGRLGRSWQAPAGGGLLMSVVFRPPPGGEIVAEVPMAIGLAALRALADCLPGRVPLQLKWPNDLLLGGGKLGGLLSEAMWLGHRLEALIVGLGVNVGARQAELPSGAVSLAGHGLPVPGRGQLAGRILAHADPLYRRLLDGGSIIPTWSDHLATLGQMVTARTPEGVVSGVAIGVAADGALLVRRQDGTIQELHAADVTLA